MPDKPQLRIAPPPLVGGGASIPPQHRPLDNPAGVAELLLLAFAEKARKSEITAPPLPWFEEEVYDVMAGLAALLVSKQADYGPSAINDSPGGALAGINVRMHDKLSRAQHLRRSEQANHEPNYESLRDTYRDLANYAVIAVMVLDGTWPK